MCIRDRYVPEREDYALAASEHRRIPSVVEHPPWRQETAMHHHGSCFILQRFYDGHYHNRALLYRQRFTVISNNAPFDIPLPPQVKIRFWGYRNDYH